MRIVLAIAAGAVAWSGSVAGIPSGAVASAVYLVAGGVFFLWVTRPSGAVLLASLLVDTAFLLTCVDYSYTPGFVLAALWFFYLQASALLLHGWQQIAAIGGLSAAFLLLFRPGGWQALLLVSVPATLLALLANWQRSQLEDRLFSASRQAVMFRGESERARSEERDRIANDFHDGPLQAFLSVQMRLEVVRRLLIKNQETGLKELSQLQELFQSQVAEMRSFLRGMRPSEVEATELLASLSRLTSTFQKDAGISATFSGNAGLGDQQPEVAMEIVQMVREALNNVRKHAKATAVAVAVERSNGWLQISIDDNGAGFPFGGGFSLDELELLRLGPASIKRRVRTLNGELNVDSSPGHGASLRIRIPQ